MIAQTIVVIENYFLFFNVLCSLFLLRSEYCVSVPHGMAHGALLLDKTVVSPLPLLQVLTTPSIKCHIHTELFKG